jgi:cholesterol transport system auxiliary component
MRRTLFLLLLAPALSGCLTLLPKSAPAQFYRFGVDPPQAAPPENPAAAGVVLEQVDMPRAASSDGILTVTGPKAAYIGGARWVSPARVLFQEALQRKLGAGGGASRLADLGDVAAQAFLRIDVTRFEADYDSAGPPKVRVALIARLTGRNGALIDELHITEEADASENTVSAIVAAFDGATHKAIADVGDFTNRAAKRLPRPDPQPSPSAQ